MNRLQERVAALLGKPAALFFPSGTMANQAALRVHTRPGDVVIAARDAHILRSTRRGAASALSGLQIKTIGSDGAFTPDEVRAALHPRDVHFAPTTLLAVENTHNAAGGRVLRPERARGGRAHRPRGGARAALRRRPALERGGRAGPAAGRARRALRHRLRVPVEGPRRSGGLARGRLARARRDACAASASMLGGGMRQAGVRRRGRLLRARPSPRAPRRGSRERAAAGARARGARLRGRGNAPRPTS